MDWIFLLSCVLNVCICVPRKKTQVFEEFLITWQERLRKLEQPTTMSVKLQAEVDKYKVPDTQIFIFFYIDTQLLAIKNVDSSVSFMSYKGWIN